MTDSTNSAIEASSRGVPIDTSARVFGVRASTLSRRRAVGLALAAAAVAIVGGSLPFVTRLTDASRTQNSATTGIPMTPGRANAFARWDAYYVGTNVVAVRTAMARSNSADLNIAFEWIAERRVTALYPDMVGYLADPQIDLRDGALGNLLLVPPFDLKGYLPSIQAARALETDPGMQIAMDRLIVAVAKS